MSNMNCHVAERFSEKSSETTVINQFEHLPLHTVEPARLWITGGCVMAADRVQETIAGGNTNTTTSLRHRRAQGPFIGVWVKTLDGAQT